MQRVVNATRQNITWPNLADPKKQPMPTKAFRRLEPSYSSRVHHSWLWTTGLTALLASLLGTFSVQKVPKPPRSGNPAGEAKQAQAILSTLSGPYGQHLCRCLATSSCPADPKDAQPCPWGWPHGGGSASFVRGRNVVRPEKMPPFIDFRKHVFFISKQIVSHWQSHGRRWDYKECISK